MFFALAVDTLIQCQLSLPHLAAKGAELPVHQLAHIRIAIPVIFGFVGEARPQQGDAQQKNQHQQGEQGMIQERQPALRRDGPQEQAQRQCHAADDLGQGCDESLKNIPHPDDAPAHPVCILCNLIEQVGHPLTVQIHKVHIHGLVREDFLFLVVHQLVLPAVPPGQNTVDQRQHRRGNHLHQHQRNQSPGPPLPGQLVDDSGGNINRHIGSRCGKDAFQQTGAIPVGVFFPPHAEGPVIPPPGLLIGQGFSFLRHGSSLLPDNSDSAPQTAPHNRRPGPAAPRECPPPESVHAPKTGYGHRNGWRPAGGR